MDKKKYLRYSLVGCLFVLGLASCAPGPIPKKTEIEKERRDTVIRTKSETPQSASVSLEDTTDTQE